MSEKIKDDQKSFNFVPFKQRALLIYLNIFEFEFKFESHKILSFEFKFEFEFAAPVVHNSFRPRE